RAHPGAGRAAGARGPARHVPRRADRAGALREGGSGAGLPRAARVGAARRRRAVARLRDAAVVSGAASVWYFAYGSNMQAATFRGRRGITPIRALPGRAPGWQLVLDKPGVVLARCGVASIVPAPGDEVLGVLYELAPADLAQVDLSEGVLI